MRATRGALRIAGGPGGAIAVACAALAACLMLGCVATAQSGPTRGVVVSGPPPAPLAEERPPPPPGPSVWIAGYWHWSGMQYAWIPGHWETAPPGATWSGPRYTVTDGTTIYEPGTWKAAPKAPPRASAFH